MSKYELVLVPDGVVGFEVTATMTMTMTLRLMLVHGYSWLVARDHDGRCAGREMRQISES